MRTGDATPAASAKACEFCGNPFVPKQKRSRFCSIQCYRHFYYRQHKERLIEYSSSYGRSHPERMRLYMQNYRLRHPSRPSRPHERTCPACGNTFVYQQRAQKYCCSDCRLAGRLEVLRRAKLKYRASHRESVLEADKRWRDKNKDKVRRYHLKYVRTHRDHEREYHRMWRHGVMCADPVMHEASALERRKKECEYNRRWRALHKDHVRDYKRSYYKIHKVNLTENEKNGLRILERMRYYDRCERFSRDPAAYAEFRKKSRERQAAVRKGRKVPYAPRLCMRIPDWACMGEDLSKMGSVFLETSIEKNAYGRELAIARGKQLGRFEDD